jgi:hypothetical protein
MGLSIGVIANPLSARGLRRLIGNAKRCGSPTMSLFRIRR